MHQRYYQPEQWMGAARNAINPRLLSTMALSVLAAVVIYGLFSNSDGDSTLGTILLHFVGGMGSLFALLFGLTALAHQLQCQINGVFVPNTIEASRFAWGRAQSILMLPLWGAGALLALILVEMLALSLANIPGLGMILLALLAVPLLLLNTVVAIALMLALFNIAARVAIADADATTLKNDLWHLLKEKLPELLIYNLGGVLVTLFVAALLLSPLWLGAEVTLALIDYTASEPFIRVSDATGFWGGIAHLVGLVMLGLLLAAVVSVPSIVITQMTLLVHLELAEAAAKEEAKSKKAKGDAEKSATKTTAKRTTKRATKDSTKAASKTTKKPTTRKRTTAASKKKVADEPKEAPADNS